MKIDISKEREEIAKRLGEILGVKVYTITPNPPRPPLGVLQDDDPFIQATVSMAEIAGNYNLHIVSAYSPEESVMKAELDELIGRLLDSEVYDYIGSISAYCPVYSEDQQIFLETKIRLTIPLI